MKTDNKSVGKMFNKEFGNLGERAAKDFLLAKGYTFVEANYKNKVGEIDLIFLDGKYIVFVEVKTRLTNKYGYPEEAVNYNKQAKIRRVATLFMLSKRWQGYQPRFDVVGIMGGTLNHTINAF